MHKTAAKAGSSWIAMENDVFNWIIAYDGKAFRLDMAKLNKGYGEKQIKQVTSDMFFGKCPGFKIQ